MADQIQSTKQRMKTMSAARELVLNQMALPVIDFILGHKDPKKGTIVRHMGTLGYSGQDCSDVLMLLEHYELVTHADGWGCWQEAPSNPAASR